MFSKLIIDFEDLCIRGLLKYCKILWTPLKHTYSYCEVGGVARLEPAPGRVLPPLWQDPRLPPEHDASVHVWCGTGVKQAFSIPYLIFCSVFTRLKLPKNVGFINRVILIRLTIIHLTSAISYFSLPSSSFTSPTKDTVHSTHHFFQNIALRAKRVR